MSRDAVLIAHLLAYSEYEPIQLPPDTRGRRLIQLHTVGQ
jgi:hypothetical protein